MCFIVFGVLRLVCVVKRLFQPKSNKGFSVYKETHYSSTGRQVSYLVFHHTDNKKTRKKSLKAEQQLHQHNTLIMQTNRAQTEFHQKE